MLSYNQINYISNTTVKVSMSLLRQACFTQEKSCVDMASDISYMLVAENNHYHSFPHRMIQSYVIYPDYLPHRSLPKQAERSVVPPVLDFQ